MEEMPTQRLDRKTGCGVVCYAGAVAETLRLNLDPFSWARSDGRRDGTADALGVQLASTGDRLALRELWNVDASSWDKEIWAKSVALVHDRWRPVEAVAGALLGGTIDGRCLDDLLRSLEEGDVISHEHEATRRPVFSRA